MRDVADGKVHKESREGVVKYHVFSWTLIYDEVVIRQEFHPLGLQLRDDCLVLKFDKIFVVSKGLYSLYPFMVLSPIFNALYNDQDFIVLDGVPLLSVIEDL